MGFWKVKFFLKVCSNFPGNTTCETGHNFFDLMEYGQKRPNLEHFNTNNSKFANFELRYIYFIDYTPTLL